MSRGWVVVCRCATMACVLSRELLAQLGGELGTPLIRVQPLAGETGAVSAVLRQQRVVVKVTAHPSPWARHVPRMLHALRQSGAPVPRELHRGRVGQVSYSVQEFLPGATPLVLPGAVWTCLHRAHTAQRGLAARLGVRHPVWTWNRWVHACVDVRGPWAARWQALARSSPAGSAFVDRVQARLRTTSLPELPEDDVVHGDLHHGNLLVSGGQLSGIIDWDDACPGDRRADLITLLLSARATADDAALADVLLPLVRADLEPELRWLYATRDIARSVGWFALHHPGWDTPTWLHALTAVLDELQ